MPPLNHTMIAQLRKQGLNDNQIVQQLRQQGYNPQQIFDSMSLADVNPAAAPPEIGGFTGQGMPPPPGGPAPPMPGMPRQGASDERVQQIAESIINEKWDELIGDVQQIAVWKESVEKEIQVLKDTLTTLRDDFTKLHQSVLGKVSEYDQHMQKVGTQLSAVETVFKQTIPQFTENVHALERYTKKLGISPETPSEPGKPVAPKTRKKKLEEF